MLHWCYNIIHPSYHAVTLKGIILTAPTLMFGPVTHHMCVRRSESSSLCALMILSPILVSYYRSLHVSFSLQGPDVTACFPYHRELVHWEEKKSEQDSAATVVLA
ncbi:hypothetical protein CesoFtcFv8_008592 [Champsocephalus esox]|uniref:Uncharacterized protein n=1 Tax=Champsocephalus esox TaxID=159716 RepID=A0AAN8H235_9TELE|nr:hypothetical protein CesoFtcFv8_008592 [Champsocephalus esox]